MEQGAGDGHHLLDGDREFGQRAGHVNVDIECGERGLGIALDARPVDGRSVHRKATDEDVLGDGKVGAEIDFLKHRADAQFLRVINRLGPDGLSIQQDLPGIR